MADPASLVGAGGILGAILRHLVYQAIEDETFPFGTLVVNVVGSLVLGFVTFIGAESAWLLFVGTGACGSFTTFSTFSVDTVRLGEEGNWTLAATYVGANTVGALFAIGVAWLIVRTVPGW